MLPLLATGQCKYKTQNMSGGIHQKTGTFETFNAEIYPAECPLKRSNDDLNIPS